jgi:hypothetical protein
MYYMRREEAEELANQGARDDNGILFRTYLEDPSTRWRFPFPDEDGGIPASCEYERGYNLPAGKLKLCHQDITLSNQPKGCGGNINIFIPCPHSEAFRDLIGTGKVKESNGGAGSAFLRARYQCLIEGEVKTLFECARCGCEQWLDAEEIEEFKRYTLEWAEGYNTKGKNPGYPGDQEKYDNIVEILNRIS